MNIVNSLLTHLPRLVLVSLAAFSTSAVAAPGQQAVEMDADVKQGAALSVSAGSEPQAELTTLAVVGEEIGDDAGEMRPSRAKSVPLDQPIIEPEPVQPPAVVEAPSAEPQPSVETEDPAIEEIDKPLIILRTEVLRGMTTRLSWSPSQYLEGIATPTPILIARGANDGPTLCLTAALHGDELNGIEIVRRVLYNVDVKTLAGTVIGVPIVNLQGFHRSSRYLTDRRDLNRYFPGNPAGSSASRIAYSFFEEVIRHCDALVDLHTGSFHRTNMPQLRADLGHPQVVQLTQGFGATVVLHSEGAPGTLRRAAVDAGIPAVTLEAGESMRLQEQAVEHGVNGITTLMSKMGMVDRFSFWGDPEPVYHRSFWVRAEQGGILFSTVELGDRVSEGDLLGEVTDPITNIKSGIVSPFDGRVIGMALNQVVLPGFAAFHVAIATPPELVTQEEQATAETSSQGSDAGVEAGDNGSDLRTPEEPDVMDFEDDLSGVTDGSDFD